ncbi:MAG TPA: hypothetical protein VIL86_13745 [Tepidisphaeraceae bacterium]|jgi:hypothetical protein
MRSWPGLIVLALSATGCTHPSRPLSVGDPDPSVKIPAIKQAVRHGDIEVSRQLVKDLDSDDPAVRFYAIEALQRLVGDDFGYRYYQDERDRRPAVDVWRKWLAGEELAAKPKKQP